MKNISSNKCLKPKDYGGSFFIERRPTKKQWRTRQRAGRRTPALLATARSWWGPLMSLSLRADPSISVRLWSVLLPWFDLCSLQCITHTHLPPRLRSAAVQRARHLGSCCLSPWQHFVQTWAVWECWTSLELCDQTLLIISMSKPNSKYTVNLMKCSMKTWNCGTIRKRRMLTCLTIGNRRTNSWSLRKKGSKLVSSVSPEFFKISREVGKLCKFLSWWPA